jgi:hypothetical protein
MFFLPNTIRRLNAVVCGVVIAASKKDLYFDKKHRKIDTWQYKCVDTVLANQIADILKMYK